MPVMAIWRSGKVAHQREGPTSILNARDTAAGQQALVPTARLQLVDEAVSTQGFARSTGSPPFGLLRDLLNEFGLAVEREDRRPLPPSLTSNHRVCTLRRSAEIWWKIVRHREVALRVRTIQPVQPVLRAVRHEHCASRLCTLRNGSL